MKLLKTNTAYTFAMIASDPAVKSEFKKECGVKGRLWFKNEKSRDDKMNELRDLANQYGIKLIPESTDVALG